MVSPPEFGYTIKDVVTVTIDPDQLNYTDKLSFSLKLCRGLQTILGGFMFQLFNDCHLQLHPLT